ncbi:phage portal protein [Sphingomonas aquatilis]|uniref:phage portal protein n=1 Tax=Sphingomonas aquatilis TaxID=93063 RepID=UPI0023F7B0B8|nr:phage portal protein [Sphingomonas aquatilis]MCI4653117.1 phage portal protein [Sphingomonas aquatilis]
MRTRAQSALRAWRAGDAAPIAAAEDLPVGLPIGPAVSAPSASADGMNDAGGLTVLNLLGHRTRGAPVAEQDALSVPAVLRALEVLCGLFAMTPFHYYRVTGDGKERVRDAPQALMFTTSANAVQPAFLLKELMLGDLLMCGRFGGYIHRDSLYRPHMLSRLLPGGISPVQHWDRNDGLEMFYDAQLPDGTRERLTRNDLWFVPGFSRDGLIGVDRLKLLADTFEAASSMNEFAARFWDNNAQPSTVLTTKAKVEQTEKLRIRQDWSQRFAGPRNAGAVAVLDQEMKAEFLSHNNEEAQFIETRGFSVVEVARAFGVPPHVLFELSRATFSNIEQQSLELYLYSMLGHFGRAEAHMTHAFAEPGHFFESVPDALLRGDIKSRYEAYAIAIDKGVLNPDEVRDLENRNKRPGGGTYRVGSGSTLEGQQPVTPAGRQVSPPNPSEDQQ